MPFVSQAQRKYLFAKHPAIAREFAAKTPKGAKLPEHVKGKKKKTIAQTYQSATKGLQNYGRNIAKRVSEGQRNQPAAQKSGNTYRSINPFPNPFKASSYKKTKPRVGVNNKMKGSYGETILQKGKPAVIRINVKKHKGNKEELADTIKHELYHAKHPEATEKETYKATSKKIGPKEQGKLIAKLTSMKKINYKRGAIKRKLKITRNEKLQPGDLIKRSRSISRPEKVAIMGLV